MGKKMIVYISQRSIKALLLLLGITLVIWTASKMSVPAFGTDTISSEFISLILIGIALGTDAFSLSIGIGMKRICAYDIFKTSLVIGIFHIIMPLAGMFLGIIFGDFLGIFARYLGSILIALIGGNMIWESLKGGDIVCDRKLIGWSLIMLAISVSLDALTIGFGLGTFGFSIPLVVTVFGLFGGLMTAIGLSFGKYIGDWIGEKSETVGGVVLIILGIKMFIA